MRDCLVLVVHLIVTMVRLGRPGGLRSVVAESLLVRHQLRRKRAPNLQTADRLIDGLCALLIRPSRLVRSAIVVKPVTLLRLHQIVRKRKYGLLFSPQRRQRPGPKGAEKELIDAVVEMKRRNRSWGCPRMAHWLSVSTLIRMWCAVS